MKDRGTSKPLKQEASQGGRVMRQTREKESLSKNKGSMGAGTGKKKPTAINC